MKKPTPLKELAGTIYRVYRVVEDRDKTEGRGGTVVVGHYHSEIDAKEAAIGKGAAGQPGAITEVELLSTDGGQTGYHFSLGAGVVRCIMPGRSEVRAAALSKLTHEEREALGL